MDRQRPHPMLYVVFENGRVKKIVFGRTLGFTALGILAILFMRSPERGFDWLRLLEIAMHLPKLW